MTTTDYFESDGELIYYSINPELMFCAYNKHGELIKAQRMILFFDSLGNAIGSGPHYVSAGEITCVSKQDALGVYQKFVSGAGNR